MLIWSAQIIGWSLTLWLLAQTNVNAQGRSAPDEDIHFERVEGLSHNTVLSITQDQEGFLWIGTPDGLNRYDGYTFVVHRHDRTDPTSISNNSVKALVEDREGNLWVGTDRGLDRLDRKTGKFIRYALRPDSAAPRRQAVRQLLLDGSGRVWVAAFDGVYRYDRETDRFAVYRHLQGDPNSLASEYPWSLYEGRDGMIWAGTQIAAVVHRYDAEGDRFVRTAALEDWNNVKIVYEDKEGRIWLSGRKNVALLPASERISRLPDLPEVPAFQTVLEERNGLIWAGSSDGIHQFDPSTGAHRSIRLDESDGAFLQNEVRTLYQDQTGHLWAGTSSGLYRRDRRGRPFHHVGHDPTDHASIMSAGTVMAVLEDRHGIVWVGTLGGGLNRLDRRTGEISSYRHRPGDAGSLCNDLIWSLLEDGRGLLWIGTNEGLCYLDPQTGRFTRVDLSYEGVAGPPLVHAMRSDGQETLWIATSVGLYRLNLRTQKAAWYRSAGDSRRGLFPQFYLQSVCLDSEGYLWMGSLGGDFFRMDPRTETFTAFSILETGADATATEGIWAIHEDRRGMMWLGSDFGLIRFDPRSGASLLYTHRDGLPGSIVYTILEDDVLGRLWLSTNRGLARFDERLPEGRRVRIYDGRDGLVNTEFNRRAGFKGSDGTFFFGGLEGLTWFHPTALRENLDTPPVVITRIEVSNRDSTRTANPYRLDELLLTYRDYTVAFEFAALNFSNPHKNRYRYRLEGFDAGWIDAGTQRHARYTNIPPGSYRFRVTGSNNDGHWNEAGAALSIRITPPFWQTWWFRLLVLTAVVGLLTAAYRLRVARLIDIERMRLRIAGDLHDDIGSNLSSIALLSDIVSERGQLGERERRQLAKISLSARAMVEALRDIVWSIDPKSEQKDDLILRMQDAAAAMLGGTPFTFEKPEDGFGGSLDMDVRRHLFLSYKEMLHNVARHARASSVAIRVQDLDGRLVLTVSDDGVGFDPSNGAGGTGLKNLRERAARIGGSLEVDSIVGKGSTIRLLVPTGYAARKRRERVMRAEPRDRRL